MGNELVTLDGYPLTGISREGIWKRLGELEGWFDSPEIKRDRYSRPHGDGDVETEINFESRLITFNGRVRSKNHDYLHEAANRLVALPGRGKKKLVVQGHGPTQWALVDPRGKVKTSFETDSYLSFQIPLEATDPFKYGQLRTVNVASGVEGSVHHRGTTEAWPVVTVTGNMPDGYTLTFRSQQVSVPMGLTPSITHRIEYKTRRLYVNGEVFFGAFGKTDFRSMAPGVRRSFDLTCPTGSGTAKVELVDTFI